MAENTTLPSLHALHVFEAAARHMRVTEASRELHITQTAVSHQVKALESELGVALFRRGPRHVALTPVGRAWSLRSQISTAANDVSHIRSSSAHAEASSRSRSGCRGGRITGR